MNFSTRLLAVLVVCVLLAGFVFSARAVESVRVDSLIVDSSANALLKVSAKAAVVIEKVIVNTEEFSFNESMQRGSSKSFYLTGINSLCGNKRTRNALVVVSYLDSFGVSRSTSRIVSPTCVHTLKISLRDYIVGMGSGTTANPFIINSCKELQNINSNLSASYVIGADIDCSKTSTWNDLAGFVPLGTESTPFIGNLSGANNSVTGLYIYRPDMTNVGLFGYANGSDLLVSDLTLVDANVTGADNVGAFFGTLVGSDLSYSGLSFGGDFVYVFGSGTFAAGGGTFSGSVGGFEEFGYSQGVVFLPEGQNNNWGALS